MAAASLGVAAYTARSGVMTTSVTSSFSSSDGHELGETANQAVVDAVRTDAGDSLTLKTWNDDYEKQPASLGSGYYKWSYNMEPGRSNHMLITSDNDSEATYTWYVLDADDSANFKAAVHGKTGTTMDFTPTKEDSGRVFGIAVVKELSGSYSSQRFNVACKYVRREFRELIKSDQTAYFDALATIYHTTTEEGQKLYGDKFRGSDWFIKKHLGADTMEGCTPWHDSEVFVTAHAAFNLEYEGSLRSIDESLSAHYWEITVDTTRYAGNWKTQSPIFSADMFGSYSTDSESLEHAYIQDGRFTDVQFYGCDDNEDSCPEHSIFKYMIDANSYQKGRTLERSGSVCGVPTLSKLPGCQFADRAMESKNLKKFWANVELRYHGDNHALIGGVRGCKYSAVEELSGYAHDSLVMRYAEDIVLYMVAWGRTLFSKDNMYLGEYSGTVSCPHSSDSCVDETDCTCTLPTVIEAIEAGRFDIDYAVNVLTETGLYEDICGASGWAAQYDSGEDGDDVSVDNWESAFSELTASENEDLLIFIAKAAAYQAREIMAYSLSLGSVNDPIFWGAHNSWERMWHFKRMEEGSDTPAHQRWWNSWNETNILNSSSAVTCSWSSGAQSTLPFYDLMKDEETTNKYYNNMDMLRMFHPNNKALPHIYDSLEYSHCSGEEEDDVDTKHAEFRVNLYSRLRKKMAQMYGAKVKRGYTEHEASQLNSYYEYLFDHKTLDNYGDRPIFEATYAP